MQGKKILVILVAVCLAAAFLPGGAFAGSYGFVCKVLMAGPVTIPGGTKVVMIEMTSISGVPAFTEKWFQVIAGEEDRMLAVALTAMVYSRKVYMETNLETTGYAKVDKIYLTNVIAP